MWNTALHLFSWFFFFIQVLVLVLILTTLALAKSSKDVPTLKDTRGALCVRVSRVKAKNTVTMSANDKPFSCFLYWGRPLWKQRQARWVMTVHISEQSQCSQWFIKIIPSSSASLSSSLACTDSFLSDSMTSSSSSPSALPPFPFRLSFFFFEGCKK